MDNNEKLEEASGDNGQLARCFKVSQHPKRKEDKNPNWKKNTGNPGGDDLVKSSSMVCPRQHSNGLCLLKTKLCLRAC